jgi:CPA2 family monovalent cation:H+ antiporter-2
MGEALLIKALVVILASVGTVGLLAPLRIPPAIGYLLAGLVIGPHGLHLLAASPETRFLAELGIIFLMFMVGLEFSLPAMIHARADVFGAGGLQVALTTLSVAAAVMLWGGGLPGAVLMGGAVAMSSTAITLKQLADQGEISTQHGRLALGILLFQDLATLPFLVVVGAWRASGTPDAWEVMRQLVIAAASFGATAMICRPLFRMVLSGVARMRSAEIFLLTILALALGTAFLVNLAGLSAPIGAFLAGMVVGESDFRHQVEDDIRPFRDVLLGLFFVTVGMEVDPSLFAVAPAAVIVWLIAFISGKAIVGFAAGAILRWPVHVGIRVALMLAHGGEFGLLLLTQAMAVGAIPTEIGQPALLALAMTMGLGPVLIQRSGWIAQRILGASHRLRATAEDPAPGDQSRRLSDHVLLCGCGRVGRLVAVVLEAAKLPFVAIESDLVRFRAARRLGYNVVFGDAGRPRVLEAASVSRARVVVVTFDHHKTVERLLHRARHENPAIASIVSASDDREVPVLAAIGGGTIFPENFAAGLALADQVLLMSGLTREHAAKVVTAVRAELNPELSGRVGL